MILAKGEIYWSMDRIENPERTPIKKVQTHGRIGFYHGAGAIGYPEAKQTRTATPKCQLKPYYTLFKK